IFKCCGISVEMDRTKDDLDFDYKLLNKTSTNNKSAKELNFNKIDSDDYEKVIFDNVWK
ncbi:16743_t:CDS:1, partial [Gigaspora rosea]